MTQKEAISWLQTEHPETIIPDPYYGRYSNAQYLAFPLEFVKVPKGVSADDEACMAFWAHYRGPVGKGDTPQEAHDDLYARIGALYEEKKVEVIGPTMTEAGREPVYRFDADHIWFTSDTHFCHENIVRYSGRPFKDAAEMNEELIRRWNETVPEDGTVFHLGDFCLGSSKEWNDIMYRLNGRIYLILGNHDFRNIKQAFMKRFEFVTQQMTIRVGGQTIILNHNPFLSYGGSYRDTWQLFGHVHSGPLSKTGLDLPRLKMLFPLQYDVGVDNNGFRPISFAEIKAKIEAQVQAAREAAGLEVRGNGGGRLIVFLAPAAKPATGPQKKAFRRLETVATDVIELPLKKGQSVKEEIGRKIAALSGNVRYVYVGCQPLEDFRCVVVDRNTGITESNVDTAIKILK
jgi:calcineurin-like phosphoesterase family protein